MDLGTRMRMLRQSRGLTLRQLAAAVGVGPTYLSKIENNKLEAGHAPSEALLHRCATVLDGDASELFLLAEKIPPQVRRRVIERAEAFRKLAMLDDAALDTLVAAVDGTGGVAGRRRRP